MYDRQITADTEVTFGVSGKLYRNGLIMFDRQTRSLWSHILGKAISGEYEGTQLTFIPTLHTDWKSWQARQPNTLVVNPALFGSDPYASYYASRAEGVSSRGLLGGGPERGSDIDPKQYVIGVRLGEAVKAYPFSVLNEEPVVNDTVGGIDIVVFFDESTASGAVFDRQLADSTLLEFKPDLTGQIVLDRQTNSEWDILSGRAVGGPLQGTQLSLVPITYAFWFGWVDYHGQSTVYLGD